MDKPQLAKAVVNNLVGYGVGVTTGSIIKSNVPRHENPIVNALIGASIIATSWAVSGTIHNPVRAHTDQQIDNIFAAFGHIQDAAKK